MYPDGGAKQVKMAVCRQTIFARKRAKGRNFDSAGDLHARKTALPSKCVRRPYCTLAENMVTSADNHAERQLRLTNSTNITVGEAKAEVKGSNLIDTATLIQRRVRLGRAAERIIVPTRSTRPIIGQLGADSVGVVDFVQFRFAADLV